MDTFGENYMKQIQSVSERQMLYFLSFVSLPFYIDA